MKIYFGREHNVVLCQGNAFSCFNRNIMENALNNFVGDEIFLPATTSKAKVYGIMWKTHFLGYMKIIKSRHDK